MARILLLKRLTRLLQIAVFHKQHGLGDTTITEALEAGWDRRDFLQAGVLGASLPSLMLAYQACRSHSLGSTAYAAAAITVVGAGTAGLSAAYYRPAAHRSAGDCGLSTLGGQAYG